MGKTKSLRKKSSQTPINMVGCSKAHKHNKSCSNNTCSNCGPNCHCGPNCNCPHKCPGNCYLNRRIKGGSGCGSTGCPVGGLLTGGNTAYPVGNTAYVPWKDPTLQAIQNSGYLGKLTSTIGGYVYKSSKSKGKSIKSKSIKSKSIKSKSIKSSKSKKNRNSRNFKNYKYNGGSLIPTNISNLGQSLQYNFASATNALGGYKSPVNPLPYEEQLSGSRLLRI